jgi:hypothetical protein
MEPKGDRPDGIEKIFGAELIPANRAGSICNGGSVARLTVFLTVCRIFDRF